MITKELVRKGIESKVIRFESDPDGIDSRGTVCAIGEYWFYFGGLTAEELTPSEYLANVPVEEIVEEIFDVLEDFRNTDGFEDEYEYYQCLLNEKCLDAADVVPVRHGSWVDIPDAHISVVSKEGFYHQHLATCSVCGEVNPCALKTKYCPNCGACMDGGTEMTQRLEFGTYEK